MKDRDAEEKKDSYMPGSSSLYKASLAMTDQHMMDQTMNETKGKSNIYNSILMPILILFG